MTKNTHKKRTLRHLLATPALGGLLLSFGMMQSAQAAEVDCAAATHVTGDSAMNCFSPNTVAESAKVNANFEHLRSLIAAQNAKIAALEAKLAAVSYDDATKNWRLTGVNVQIVNGQNDTDTANGTGNLVIGYNEASTRAVCSNGGGSDEASCLAAGGVWAVNQRGGSHNVVIGEEHNYTQNGGLVSGYDNAIVGKNASVTGGQSNTASGFATSVTGGEFNVAKGEYTVVSGGGENRALAELSSISGGIGNETNGELSVVLGGQGNVTTVNKSIVP